MIYFGSPTFYVDASDAMMMDGGPGSSSPLPGPAAELFLSGIASLLVFFFLPRGAWRSSSSVPVRPAEPTS